MQRTRKRSFTVYQSQEIVTHVDNTVRRQSDKQSQQKNLQQTLKKEKFENMAFGMIKSKKAKLFSKFHKFDRNTQRSFAEEQTTSTIQSLKKQIIAINSDELMSYRFRFTKNQSAESDEKTQSKEGSLIQQLIKQTRESKNQTISDKFRKRINSLDKTKIKMQRSKKLLSLRTSFNEQTRPKTQRSNNNSCNGKYVSSVSVTRFYKSNRPSSAPKEISQNKASKKDQGLQKLMVKAQVSYKSLLSL